MSSSNSMVLPVSLSCAVLEHPSSMIKAWNFFSALYNVPRGNWVYWLRVGILAFVINLHWSIPIAHRSNRTRTGSLAFSLLCSQMQAHCISASSFIALLLFLSFQVIVFCSNLQLLVLLVGRSLCVADRKTVRAVAETDSSGGLLADMSWVIIITLDCHFVG